MTTKTTTRIVCIALACAAAFAASAPAPAQTVEIERTDEALRGRTGLRGPVVQLPFPNNDVELIYRVTASDARLNRRLMGPTRRYVQGVPAEPVDSFVWDGVGSVPIEGTITIEVRPMRNLGFVEAEWTDANGRWTYKQQRFLHPDHHTSGARVGSSVAQVDAVLNEAIAHNVYLHGDTGAGAPMLPTVFAYLAMWGRAEVTLNGEMFENPFEVPAPLWLGHLMVTEGVRRPDGTVRSLTGEIFNPSRAGEGAVEPGDLEVHLTFHDELFPNTGNVPPPYSFFYHLLFEDVRIEVRQADDPERPGPPPLFPVPR